MFKFWAKLTIAILAVCGWSSATAQTPADIIVVLHGQEQALSFKNMGASVGNVNVAYLKDVKPNSVIIFGAGVGETTLEVSQRNGQKKRLVVRVLPIQTLKEQTRSQPVLKARTSLETNKLEESKKILPIEDTEATNKASVEAPIGSLPLPAAPPVPKATTSAADDTSSQSEVTRARNSFASRLEISAETIFLFDREDVAIVSSELMDLRKLQEAVSANNAEKLAASPSREQIMTLRRSSIVTPLSILYQFNARNSLALVFPYVRRQDEIIVGGNSIKTHSQGLGDVQVRFERSYPNLFKSAWDGTLELNLGLPTGKSIYNINKDQSPLGIGHFEIGSEIGTRRIFDPFAFNASIGISYTLPRTVQGISITPGFGYSLQTGVGYALSDRIVLSQQLNYTRRPNVFLSSPVDAQTISTPQSQISHSLIFMPRGGHTLQLMFNLGLNPASSDYGLGFKYIYRRKRQLPQ